MSEEQLYEVCMLRLELAFLKRVVKCNNPKLFDEFETTFATLAKESKEKYTKVL